MFAGLGNSTWVTLLIDGIAESHIHRGHLDLYLENMNLTEFPAEVFDGSEHLHLDKLHLQNNRLRTLPEGLFRNLSSLRHLYLQNNGLEELPSSACAETMST